MHPDITYQLVKFKIADDLRHADLERRARLAATNRPQWIDFSSLGRRLRARLLGGPALGGSSAVGGKAASAGA